MKANSVINTTINAADNTITFDVRGAGSVTLNMSRMSPENLAYAALHGMKQRVSDAAAISRNPDNGQPATPQDKLDAMAALVAHYESGGVEWGIRKATGGAGAKPSGLTLRALAQVQGVGVATMRTRVDGLAERKGLTAAAILRELAKSPAVAKVIAEMKAVDAPDADGLLGELV